MHSSWAFQSTQTQWVMGNWAYFLFCWNLTSSADLGLSRVSDVLCRETYSCWTLTLFIVFLIKELYDICSAGFKFGFQQQILFDIMDPEKKDSCDVNPKKDFICWDGLPSVNWGSNCINNESRGHLLTGASHVLCVMGRTSNWTQTALLVYTVWVNHCRETVVLSFYQWTETCTVQSELQNLDTSFTWNGPNWEPGCKLSL